MADPLPPESSLNPFDEFMIVNPSDLNHNNKSDVQQTDDQQTEAGNAYNLRPRKDLETGAKPKAATYSQ